MTDEEEGMLLAQILDSMDEQGKCKMGITLLKMLISIEDGDIRHHPRWDAMNVKQAAGDSWVDAHVAFGPAGVYFGDPPLFIRHSDMLQVTHLSVLLLNTSAKEILEAITTVLAVYGDIGKTPPSTIESMIDTYKKCAEKTDRLLVTLNEISN